MKPLQIVHSLFLLKVRAELQAEIKRQRVSGRCHRQLEVTTKHGKLKTDRKQMPRKMYVDDLAVMDILTEVIFEQRQIKQIYNKYCS